MIDIKQFAIQQSADIVIKHPVTGEPLTEGKKTATVKLMSRANPAYRKAAIAFVEAIRNESATTEEKEAASAEFLKTAVLGFSNIDATPDDITKPEYSWLREQIDAALGDVSNFLPQPSNS